MQHRLQRVLILLFAWELVFFFVLPPLCLLWRFGSLSTSELGKEHNRDSVCIILLAICEFGCGVCGAAMSAFSIYMGAVLDARQVANGLITLCAVGTAACLFFSLLGNPKYRIGKKLCSRATRHEAELSVTGAIMNLILALSAGLANTQASIPGLKFSVSVRATKIGYTLLTPLDIRHCGAFPLQYPAPLA
ncbi:hypothetical protein cyc_06761 [Cyclospora cayetanensis]|uniref:Transmembrane protein n=1 Tax=Cyclospora cayetanensis TaxID=88456 RepID=A0A1D3CUG3_9EIME|nr:hypothetical protein cyc_06761 [Cyclospora cayetanensis]